MIAHGFNNAEFFGAHIDICIKIDVNLSAPIVACINVT